ncbi:MAG: ATP-binding protein [Cyanothece sp. SIO1E1]|nr:ATP-binding protein [Cyanothece sp. SIO1E1]
MSLETMLKSLGLTTIGRVLPELIPMAEKEAWSYQQLLERLVAEEIAHRSERRTQTLITKAKFPFEATIDTFDFTFRSDLKRQMLGRFLGPELVSERRSLILEGPPGTGKTHLCIAMAYKSIQNGFTARFTTAAALIHELCVAPERNIALQPYLRPQVLVIDEMGYLGYGPGAADVLFQVVDQRYLKGKPILFTTNKPLNLWGRVLHDEELARAIIDRTLHHGEYLKLSGPSFRLKGRQIDLDSGPSKSNQSSLTSSSQLDNS